MSYTSEDVQRLREKLRCSIQEACSILDKEEMARRVSDATTFEDLRGIMEDMIHKLY